MESHRSVNLPLKRERNLENLLTPMLVVAAALERDGRILLQQRAFSTMHGGLWEFPGGKVEAGETPEAALARELAEELGTRVGTNHLVPVTFASGSTANAPARSLVILLYRAAAFDGEPQCLEGEAIGWFRPEEIAALPMPPLDYPLAAALLRAMGQ